MYTSFVPFTQLTDVERKEITDRIQAEIREQKLADQARRFTCTQCLRDTLNPSKMCNYCTNPGPAPVAPIWPPRA